MSNNTDHYGLHQWEADDDFLRSDFNTDFAKIDAAIYQTKEYAESGITRNAYNIYNLLLQNYYDGKYTDYKKALMLDGFTGDDDSRTLTSGLVIYDNQLWLYEEGESGSERWYNTTHYNGWNADYETLDYTVQSVGYLTGFTFYVNSSVSGDAKSQLIRCYINGVSTASISTTYYSADVVDNKWTVNLTTPILVTPGDVIYFMTLDDYGSVYYYGTSSNAISGSYNITPIQGDSGTVSSTENLGVDWTESHLWIRGTGGAITPKINGTAMTLVETTAGESFDGETCTEYHYTGGSGSDTLALTLNLDLDGDDVMTLFDYGLVVI